MERLSNTRETRRIAISVIALYALLVQAFFAPPAAALDSVGAAICQQNGSGADAPDGARHRDHGLCCILACAASGFLFIAASFGLVAFLLRSSGDAAWRLTPATDRRPPLRHNVSARGPPLTA